MDKAIFAALKSYNESSPPSAPHKAPAAVSEGSNVLKADFELFHNAPAPNPSSGDGDEVSQYQQGITEGERRAAQLQAATIKVMQDSLTSVQAQFNESLAHIKNENAKAVTQIFEALLPALARHSFIQDFNNILQTLVSAELSGSICITCAADDKAAIERLLAASPNPALFKLTANSAAQGQVSLSWENGGSDIDYRNTVQSAQNLLSQHFDMPLAAASPQPNLPPKEEETL